MYALTVKQRGLENHPVIREILQLIETYGVMHQGLGPGVVREITQGPSDGPSLLCELNTLPGHTPQGHIATLAHAAGGFAAAADLAAVLEDWREKHHHLPLAIGQNALMSHLKAGWALRPQGVYIAAGTRQRGALLEAHSLQMTLKRLLPLRSISKALVCAATLVLQDQGLLDIDQPLAAYLPEWGSSSDKKKTTLKHVMTHTSGIPNNMSDLLSVIQDPQISLAESSKRLAQQRLQHEPGTEFSYNNPAYNILGAVAERVTGSSWHQVFQDTLAGPLGLQDTYFVNVFAGEITPSNPSLGMGLISTGSDMMQFMSMVMHEGAITTTPAAQADSSTINKSKDYESCWASSGSSRRILSEAAFKLFISGHSKKSPGGVDHVWDTLAAPAGGTVPEKAQAQIDIGLLPQASVAWGLQQWSQPTYALGSWLNRHSVTGKLSISWIGAYGSLLSIDDLDGDDPVWLLYLSYSHTPSAPGCRPGTMLQAALERCLQRAHK